MRGAISIDRAKSVDDQVLELAAMDLSPEEISRRLHGIVNPARVRIMLDELTKSGNWMTDVQKERAIMSLLHTNLMSMRQTNDPENFKLQLQYAETLLKRLDRKAEVSDRQLATYNQNVGRTLGRVVDLALTYMKGALREEVDPEKWDALVVEALEEARVEISRNEVEG